ncbi:MAG: hypothetical protein V4820_07200 [Pseudomonadota bacterium]
MPRIRKLLFLIASKGRARLVQYRPGEDRFVTTWRYGERVNGRNAPHVQTDLVHEVIRQADKEIAADHLEGLFIIAPASEIEELREHMERGLIVVGGVVDDRINPTDAELTDLLVQALQAPTPER